MNLSCCKNNSADSKNLKEIINFLKIISEENRFKIVCILCFGEKCVCDIWQCLKLPQNLVSHHLKILKDFDLVSSKKEGLKIFYRLNKKAVKKYLKLLNKILR
jgi:ArsR family transcriptional regulator